MNRSALGGFLLLTAGFSVYVSRSDPDSLHTRTVSHTVLACCVVVAGWAAVREQRQAQRRPLQLVAVSLLLSLVGNVIDTVWSRLHPDELAPVGSVDVPWLGAQACLIAALTMMVRRRGLGRLRGSVLDMVVLAGAFALARWTLQYAPALKDGSDPRLLVDDPTLAVIITGYDLADLVIAALAVLLLLTPGPRSAATGMIAGAALMRVASAVMYSSWPDGVVVPVLGDLAILFVALPDALMAAAVAHRGAGKLTTAATRRHTVHPARLVFLAGALLTAPLIALTRHDMSTTDRVVLMAAATVIVLCVIARIGLALREQERAEAVAVYRASHDGLTGLANRSTFHAALTGAVQQRSAALVCYIDLDGFKPVNDAHGHAAGDAVLVAVARRLTETVRAGDLVARLGGDEFAVLCPGQSARHEVTELADRILAGLEAPIPLGDDAVRVGASIGMSFVDRDGARSVADVLRQADTAMYAAKRQGRGRWVLASA
ncbi:MAG TPA: GGDEF domain-containing protein [Pilimelia sp.]|nr:GGDEF domain-containing protein [Pilimelia sp.]